MERFREHEKEFKMKQFSKRALQMSLEKSSNFVEDNSDESGSNDDSNSSKMGSGSHANTYGEEIEEDGEAMLSEEVEEEDENGANRLALDKEWLANFIQNKLKKAIGKVEDEVNNIRNKKIRGTTKKQKDMLKTLNSKLTLMRATRDKCEELSQTMEFLEGDAIKPLKNHLRKYNDNSDNEQLRLNVENEVARLIDLADSNRD